MEFCILGSGSRGNATLVRHGSDCVLIDCGFPLAQLKRRLHLAAVCVEQLTAVLITHEHGDHCGGLAALCAHTEADVYATGGTWRAMALNTRTWQQRVHVIAGDTAFALGSMQVMPVTVPHDAREPVQFRLDAMDVDLSVGVLTDLGHITPHVRQQFANCHGLILEFNYEPELLRASDYPPALQDRIAGPQGHLANAEAAELLAALPPGRLQHLVAAHLSQQNNRPQHVQQLLGELLHDRQVACHIAAQDECGDWLSCEPHSHAA